jgi:hypothetical protein
MFLDRIGTAGTCHSFHSIDFPSSARITSDSSSSSDSLGNALIRIIAIVVVATRVLYRTFILTITLDRVHLFGTTRFGWALTTNEIFCFFRV